MKASLTPGNLSRYPWYLFLFVANNTTTYPRKNYKYSQVHIGLRRKEMYVMVLDSVSIGWITWGNHVAEVATQTIELENGKVESNVIVGGLVALWE